MANFKYQGSLITAPTKQHAVRRIIAESADNSNKVEYEKTLFDALARTSSIVKSADDMIVLVATPDAEKYEVLHVLPGKKVHNADIKKYIVRGKVSVFATTYYFSIKTWPDKVSAETAKSINDLCYWWRDPYVITGDSAEKNKDIDSVSTHVLGTSYCAGCLDLRSVKDVEESLRDLFQVVEKEAKEVSDDLKALLRKAKAEANRRALSGTKYMDGTLNKVKAFLDDLGCTTEWQLGMTEDEEDDLYDAFCFNFPGESEGWNTVEMYRNGTLGASINDGEDYTSGKTLEQIKTWLKAKVSEHA